MNSLSTNSTLSINNLNNKTNFTNLLVSNASTLLSSLNVSSNSNLNNLNVSGTSYFNGLLFAQSNLYAQSILPAFDVATPNKSIKIDTRGLGNINLQTSGISTIIIDRNNTSIMSSLNVSGTTKLNGGTTCMSSLNVSGVTIINNNLGVLTPSINSNYNLQVNGMCSFGVGSQYVSPFITGSSMTLWGNGNTGGVPEQLIISDSGTTASTNMALLVGTYYNSNTNPYSSFQSIMAGVGSKPLLLNPLGGNVGIGAGRITTTSALLQVGGTAIIENAATCLSTLNVVGNITTSGLSVFNINSNLNSLSSYSYLNISGTNNNLNSISSYSYLNIGGTNNNLNSLSSYSYLNISGTNNNLNNLSSYSYLNISGTNANLNSLSTNSVLSINNHTTSITNLALSTATLNTNVNSLSTSSILSINNLNSTSTTLLNMINSLTGSSTLTNLNTLSTNSILSINNLNSTSTTVFNNLNSLSTNSILSINNLNATSTTILII